MKQEYLIKSALVIWIALMGLMISTCAQAVPTGQVANNLAEGIKGENTKAGVGKTTKQPNQQKTIKPPEEQPKKSAKSRHFEEAIHKVALKHNISEDLIHAIVYLESKYNVKALGRAGEIGLMQIKPSTARLLGYRGTVKNLYNPAVNLEYGTRYLAKAINVSDGSICGIILKYNAGHAAKRMNTVSLQYCQKIKIYLQNIDSK